MTSQINPYNIDGTFPVAGQDNSSQGFRDNFTNTKNNFIYAANEITDLQNKAILKAALTGNGTPLSTTNDMSGAPIRNAEVRGFRETKVDLGTTSGAVTIDFSAAPFQTVTTNGSISFVLTNFPAAGTYAKVRVSVTVSSVTHTVTWPASVSSGIQDIAGASGQVITFGNVVQNGTQIRNGAGTYIFEISTFDGGSSYTIEDLSRVGTTVQGEFTANGNIYGAYIYGNIVSSNIGTTITGTFTANNLVANNNISASTITGNISTAIQSSITQVGTLTSANVSGNLSVGNLSVTEIGRAHV